MTVAIDHNVSYLETSETPSITRRAKHPLYLPAFNPLAPDLFCTVRYCMRYGITQFHDESRRGVFNFRISKYQNIYISFCQTHVNNTPAHIYIYRPENICGQRKNNLGAATCIKYFFLVLSHSRTLRRICNILSSGFFYFFPNFRFLFIYRYRDIEIKKQKMR